MHIRSMTRSALLAVLLAVTAVAAHAEEGTVSAMAPWEASGEVFLVSPEKLMVQGKFAGIMYIENEQKGTLDAGIMRCPMVMTMQIESKKTTGVGFCTIENADGDVAFTEWLCQGKPGICVGEMKLTGGTGKLEGASGGGAMVVRSALVETAIDLKTGGVVRSAAGLAVWPELKYKIPAK